MNGDNFQISTFKQKPAEGNLLSSLPGAITIVSHVPGVCNVFGQPGSLGSERIQVTPYPPVADIWTAAPIGREPVMKDILILLLIIAAWYLLQAYILPKMGVDT